MPHPAQHHLKQASAHAAFIMYAAGPADTENSREVNPRYGVCNEIRVVEGVGGVLVQERGQGCGEEGGGGG